MPRDHPIDIAEHRGERLGAIRVGLVELDRVMDDGVGVQMLCWLAADVS